MVAPPLITVSRACECGDTQRWTRRGMIRHRWRLECVCGRSGPWRSQPERDYARPFAASAPTTPPPPKPKG